ncbi:unnamed protein product [Ostreobium quekettii]|uniref:Radical SAM core domain-containing protein n=1 Tax=Ostreobium quekettii TaxID=121088 RepID=A0A8S1IZV8_9CHLO|nr:unnamed protein product [Ostreobium quekettii]
MHGSVPADVRSNGLSPRQEVNELISLKNFTLKQLVEDVCPALGEPPRRAHQLWKWMYHDGMWASDLDATVGQPEGFSQDFCDKMRCRATVDAGMEIHGIHRSDEGTTKIVFRIERGPLAGKMVETVIIPVERRSERRRQRRVTICVSSQVGCAMNCQFCYTGKMGLMGNLSAAQIVEQVVAARRLVAKESGTVDQSPSEATNVVFMGMGEPLDNLPAVCTACDIMLDPAGLRLSPNKVTVSTVGLVHQVRAFLAASPAQLAVSLHATTDEVRNWIAPVNRRHGLADLMAVLEEAFPVGRTARGRRVFFEYVMLDGINDSDDDARRLLALTGRVECSINLIEFNAYRGSIFRASPRERVEAFQRVVSDGGVLCTVRFGRGRGEMAACGQLGDAEGGGKGGRLLPPPERFAHAVVGDLSSAR